LADAAFIEMASGTIVTEVFLILGAACKVHCADRHDVIA